VCWLWSRRRLDDCLRRYSERRINSLRENISHSGQDLRSVFVNSLLDALAKEAETRIAQAFVDVSIHDGHDGFHRGVELCLCCHLISSPVDSLDLHFH